MSTAETYAAEVLDGLVIEVAVASKEWADEHGWIFVTPANCSYGNVNIGDSYDAETGVFTQQTYPPGED